MMLHAGTIVAGYRIEHFLGAGAMGEVYRAHDLNLDRSVAIKVLSLAVADPENAERFSREARALAHLQHPHVLQVYASGIAAGIPYIVMPFAAGGSLEQRWRAGPVSYAEVVNLLRPIAEALDYIHAMGVVHRDVKPANILLDAQGSPVLADFGIVRLHRASHTLTGTGGMLGTPAYMAPEYIAGAPVGPAIDRYALAVIAYEIIVGQKPYEGASGLQALVAAASGPLPRPRQVNPTVSRAMEQVLLRGLARDPGARFASATEFIDRLELVAGGKGKRRSTYAVSTPVRGAAGHVNTTAQPRSRQGIARWKLSIVTLFAIAACAALWQHEQLQPGMQSLTAQSTAGHGISSAPLAASPYQGGLRALRVGDHNAAISLFSRTKDRSGVEGAQERAALWRAEASAMRVGKRVVAMELLSGIVSLARRDDDQPDVTRASYHLSDLVRQQYQPLARVVAQQRWAMAGQGPDHTRYLRLGGITRSGGGVLVKTVFDGSNDGYLYALDGHTGHLLWRFKTRGAIQSDPAVSAGIVYVGSDDGAIYAVDGRNGKQVWRFRTGGPVWSPPVVADGTVYVGSTDHRVYALDAVTGKVRWAFTTHGAVGFGVAVANGVVYVGSYDGQIYGLSARTGQEQWRSATGGAVASSPVVTHGVVYAGASDGTLIALDARSGHTLWRVAVRHAVHTVAAADGMVYAATAGGYVYAMAAASGARRWQFRTGGPTAFELAFFAGTVYVGSRDHAVYAIDAGTGFMRWRFKTGGSVTASPALADNVLYVGSYDGKIYALNASTGKQLWHVKTRGQVWSSPAVVGF